MSSLSARPTPSDFDDTRDQIVDLFIKKWKPSAIALSVGLPVKRVDQIIAQEFGTRLGNRQEQILRAAMEIDWLMKPLMAKYEKDAAAGKPSQQDFRALLEGNKEMRRLFGLDAAMKVDVSVTEDRTEAELLAELAKHKINVTLLELPAPSEQIEDAVVEEKEGN